MDYAFATRPSFVAFAASIIIWIAYLIGLAFYRLYLSPLAQFPGPKFAALTQWYEFYYDVVRPGQFIFQIQKIHKRYGMLLRPFPDELTILIQISRSNCPHYALRATRRRQRLLG